MNDPVRILSLEQENFKRVRAVEIHPAPDGLTIIGGRNAQGKTSVLDGIAYALGGERFRPSAPQREGSLDPAVLRVTLSNGLLVERAGVNSALKVTDPTGKKSGQRVLDDVVEALALNIPKFLAMDDGEKARVLLDTLGIGEKLAALDKREAELYDKRHAVGIVADQKLKFWRELPSHPDCPEEPLSAADLIAKSQEVIRRNAARAEARENIASLERQYDAAEAKVARLEEELARARADAAQAGASLDLARQKQPSADESTAELQDMISNIEAVNAKIRENLAKEAAKADADDHRLKYESLTEQVDAVRAERSQLLETAPMPLPELSVAWDSKRRPILTYKSQAWDCMSGMERLRVAVSIVRRLKPECGFVLLDGLEQFDLAELGAFGCWLRDLGLQALATRVSDGSECAVIIEDGMIKPTTTPMKGDLF